MKFIIKRLLIGVTLISIIYESQCERELRKARLSHILENLNEKKNSQREGDDIFKDIDMNCAKSFFKLPQNQKMLINEFEEMIFIIGAALKCSNEEKVFKLYMNSFLNSGLKKRLNCLTWHLQQLEPTSKLVENFEISEDDLNECKEKFPIESIERELGMFEKVLGPLGEYTCGAISDNWINDFVKFFAKGAIIKFGDISEDLKQPEFEKLRVYFRDITFTTTNCIVKRFETDPAAYFINDTLSYYYKKEIQPIDLEKKYDPNGYYKNLGKVEGAIDYECVKEKLNLPEFGNISLLEVEATIIIASAKSKCIKIDSLDFVDLFLNFAVEEHQRESERFVTCAKYKLQEIEPTSKLAKTSSSDEIHKSHCRHFDIHIHTYSIPTWIYTDFVGRFNETSCGVLSGEFIELLSIKTVLLASEKDEELRKTEVEELFPTATDKLHKLADCVFENVK